MPLGCAWVALSGLGVEGVIVMRDLRPGEQNYMDADDAKRRIEPLRHKHSIHYGKKQTVGCLGVAIVVAAMVAGLIALL